jgi:hypothetical protein
VATVRQLDVLTNSPEPTHLLAAVRRIAAALDARGVSWALVGGLAVSIRVEPRFTRDIDVAVAVADDAAAEALVADLTAAGFTLLLSLEQRALGRLATVRLLPPGEPLEGVVVDLLFASSGIESAICRHAQSVEVVPGLVVPVASAAHLVAMKLLAMSPERPQDAIDLNALLGTLDAQGRAAARRAVAKIESIGANRGKSLSAELDKRFASGS